MPLEPWLPHLLIAAALLLALGGLTFWYLRYRRSLAYLLKKRTWGQLRDVVIPDGMDGQVHIDRLLLTANGLMVLESRKLRGAVFGAEKMEEWVMLDQGRRFGFHNPLPALDERIEALRQFAQGMRVEGYVLLEGPVSFPKGRPERTLVPEDLAEKLNPLSVGMPDSWRSLWGRLAGHARQD